jgi:hypothetical protein
VTTIEWTPAKKAVVACAAIGVGLLVVHSRRRYKDHNGSPIPLDADLTPAARSAVLAALAREHDPEILGVLAAKLSAAGHEKAAKVIGERTAQVAHATAYIGQSHDWRRP